MLLHLTNALCLVLLAPRAISANSNRIARDKTNWNGSANAVQDLLPAAHPNVVTDDPALLSPSESAFLFFAEGSGASGHQRLRRRSNDTSNGTNVASLSVDQTAYPSVNLLHTDSVSGITCGNRSVTVPFDTDAAFRIAASIWPFSNAFVLISYGEECGPGSNDEHSYMLVQACRAAETSRTLICSVTYIPFEVFVGQNSIVTINFGTYAPASAIQKRARYSKSEDITFSKVLSNYVSAWNYYKIFGNNNFQLYCSDCRASGSINIASTISFSIKDGINAATVRVSGETHGGLRVKMDAEAWSEKISVPDKTVLTVPLASFQISGILELNPSLSLGVSASAKIGTKGYTLPRLSGTHGYLAAGIYDLDWPDLDVTADLVDRDSSHASGLVPDVVPLFLVPVSFQTDVTANMNVRLSVGVKVLKGKFDRSFALVEQRRLTIEVRDVVNGCPSGAVTGRMTDNFFLDFPGSDLIPLLTWSTHDYTTCCSKE